MLSVDPVAVCELAVAAPVVGCRTEGVLMVTPPVPFLCVETWTQLPLPRLFDDPEPTEPDRWSFVIVTVDSSGRVNLPAACRAAFADVAVLRASTRGEVVVLRTTGAGAAVRIGGRGRLVVPCWLRDATGPTGSLLVGVGLGDEAGPVVVLAPARLLAGWADQLVGERG